MASEKIVIITKDNFELEVIQSQQPVLVDFWAPWCGPCRAVAPIMDQLSIQFEGKAKISKINVDEESEVSARYKIMSIPTVLLFKNGEVVEKVVGSRTVADYEKLIEKHL